MSKPLRYITRYTAPRLPYPPPFSRDVGKRVRYKKRTPFELATDLPRDPSDLDGTSAPPFAIVTL